MAVYHLGALSSGFARGMMERQAGQRQDRADTLSVLEKLSSVPPDQEEMFRSMLAQAYPNVKVTGPVPRAPLPMMKRRLRDALTPEQLAQFPTSMHDMTVEQAQQARPDLTGPVAFGAPRAIATRKVKDVLPPDKLAAVPAQYHDILFSDYQTMFPEEAAKHLGERTVKIPLITGETVDIPVSAIPKYAPILKQQLDERTAQLHLEMQKTMLEFQKMKFTDSQERTQWLHDFQTKQAAALQAIREAGLALQQGRLDVYKSNIEALSAARQAMAGLAEAKVEIAKSNLEISRQRLENESKRDPEMGRDLQIINQIGGLATQTPAQQAIVNAAMKRVAEKMGVTLPPETAQPGGLINWFKKTFGTNPAPTSGVPTPPAQPEAVPAPVPPAPARPIVPTPVAKPGAAPAPKTVTQAQLQAWARAQFNGDLVAAQKAAKDQGYTVVP